LILHGLHPDDLGTRVRRALDVARPTLQMHGMGARLVSVLDGVAHVRIDAGGDCDAHSADEVRAAIEAAIAETAPDLSHVEILGLPESAARRPLVALPLVTAT
jgi:Fe-S cluster biogenesis protein NfuA